MKKPAVLPAGLVAISWEGIRPLLREVTDASFHPFRKPTEIRHGVTIIHGAQHDVLVDAQGYIHAIDVEGREVPVEESNNCYINIAALLKRSAMAIEPKHLEQLNFALEVRWVKGCKPGYLRRAQRALFGEIIAALPEANRNIARHLGLLFGSDMPRKVNLIAAHRELFSQIYRDDPRLLHFFMQIVFRDPEQSGVCFTDLIGTPNSAISGLRQRLIEMGLHAGAWRYLVKLDPLQRRGWASCLIQSIGAFGSYIELLNLLAGRQSIARIYQPHVVIIGLSGLTLSPSWRKFLMEVMVRELEKAQVTGRMNAKRTRATLYALSPLLDFAGHTDLVPPKNAGLGWLRHQSRLWHDDIASRSRESLGENVDWSENAASQFNRDIATLARGSFTARLLTSIDDFFVESRTMDHCVSSRWKEAKDLACYIYHLSDASSGEVATLDVRGNGGIQTAGTPVKLRSFECRSTSNDPISKAMRQFSDWVASELNTAREIPEQAALIAA